MNAIQKELLLAREKMIEEVNHKGFKLAALTRDNVAIVEAMIRNDSAYIRSSDKTAKPVFDKNGNIKYGGSSAYWMNQLRNVLIKNKPSDYSYKDLIRHAVEAVDRENSTHLNSDNCGREEISERIYRLKRQEFLACLKDPSYKNMKLIRLISRRTSAPERARENLSFASKFCHYACFNIYEGTKYQDNYSIYDNILKSVLPWYLDYFSIEEDYDLKEYVDYRKAIDDIRSASGVEISRNGFDHLLWYYHKGRL